MQNSLRKEKKIRKKSSLKLEPTFKNTILKSYFFLALHLLVNIKNATFIEDMMSLG